MPEEYDALKMAIRATGPPIHAIFFGELQKIEQQYVLFKDKMQYAFSQLNLRASRSGLRRKNAVINYGSTAPFLKDHIWSIFNKYR